MNTCTKCGRKMNALVHDMCLFCVDVELMRLREVEAAVTSLVESSPVWRWWATKDGRRYYKARCNLIDVLRVK